jgi:hypothetical protein
MKLVLALGNKIIYVLMGKFNNYIQIKIFLSAISGFHGGKYENDSLLLYGAL